MPIPSPTPLTILTGFLGSGKTTLLLSLLPQLPTGYKLCMLKNEFGDVTVDTKLAQQESVAGVKELLNGCICCNLVGQMSDALLSLKDHYNPARIVIETSGSAFPATLAMEINRIARENPGSFVLDGVIQVIDVENWSGYQDTSYTAKLQAKYTDLIVLNKHEVAGPEREEEVLDRIRDVAEETPIVRTKRGWIDKDVVFGIDSALARNLTLENKAEKESGHGHEHRNEVDVLSLCLPASEVDADGGFIDANALEKLLTTAPKDEVYRIKGILRFRVPPPQHPDAPTKQTISAAPHNGNRWILNWAFGRWTFTPLRERSVITTIEGIEGSQSPIDVPPSAIYGCAETEKMIAALKPRKNSIEVMVETCIKTTVEVKTREVGDCAKLSFVLGRGEANRWKGRLGSGDFVKYDEPGVPTKASIEKVT